MAQPESRISKEHDLNLKAPKCSVITDTVGGTFVKHNGWYTDRERLQAR